MIERFPGQAISYTSYDSVLDDSGSVYPTEVLNKLCPGGMSPHNLVLKENCPVILLRNLLPSSGLCNGTRLICKRFFPNLIECVISIGQYQGEHVFIPKIKLRPSSSQKYPFQFQRNQFPIKLSFAMTINKSQGQTLDQVLIYLPRSCFSHGQLYVALSRARSADKVKVVSVAPTSQHSENSVKNVVS
ncbi:ATP-dependent DNA helicase PIF1-like [Chenopodium quinoa]|uniref:ATP-dependent DNA helicase PIF1-like n=1 Tax=Chenopodium quinoa TaxID=63459 RepID=UPI000B7942F3|nr:ATP-dependent DNA helicase PIF1-like [Chenopodium quinoa]XP_021762957.1 ATP-dependent DNA helicase PIF1-like [Chenopodium quinoa]